MPAVDTVKRLVQAARDIGIETLSIFAFNPDQNFEDNAKASLQMQVRFIQALVNPATRQELVQFLVNIGWFCCATASATQCMIFIDICMQGVVRGLQSCVLVLSMARRS